jgi:protein-tyrosine phosphatase
VIDLHTHVLPGIDDGPVDLGGALEMASLADDLGIAELVATPHVSWDWDTTADAMEQGVRDLQRMIHAVAIPVRLRTGAELAVTRAAELPDEELLRLRLGGGEWLLLECPLMSSSTGFDAVVRGIAERGHRVVLAHPERSPVVRRAPRRLAELVEDGMLTQVTAGALAGRFGRTVRDFAFDLVAAGLVHNVASDAHDAVFRPPGLLEALRQAEPDLPGLLDRAEWLCHDVPRAVLDGGAIPRPPGPPPHRHRRRTFMRRVLGR